MFLRAVKNSLAYVVRLSSSSLGHSWGLHGLPPNRGRGVIGGDLNVPQKSLNKLFFLNSFTCIVPTELIINKNYYNEAVFWFSKVFFARLKPCTKSHFYENRIINYFKTVCQRTTVFSTKYVEVLKGSEWMDPYLQIPQ